MRILKFLPYFYFSFLAINFTTQKPISTKTHQNFTIIKPRSRKKKKKKYQFLVPLHRYMIKLSKESIERGRQVHQSPDHAGSFNLSNQHIYIYSSKLNLLEKSFWWWKTQKIDMYILYLGHEREKERLKFERDGHEAKHACY